MPHINNFNSRFLAIIWIVSLLSGVYLTGGRSVKAADAPSPVEAPQGWQRLGPYGGKVLEVVYAPSDPNVIYALLNNKAVPVYKSTDNGKTWNFLPFPFDLITPKSLAVSPVNSSIVLFSDLSSSFRSSNGGIDWTRFDKGFNQLKFSKANPNKVYGTSGLLRKSMDSGLTWELVTDRHIYRFALDPFNENRILATTKGTRIEDRGLFESVDDGETWNLLEFEFEYKLP